MAEQITAKIDPFLPALPARGATMRAGWSGKALSDFYPRSPRGERPPPSALSAGSRWNFYPRSPRGERRFLRVAVLQFTIFLPALPARGATGNVRANGGGLRISTRAPREGSDHATVRLPHLPYYFYPRSPRGERRDRKVNKGLRAIFLPALPARGATRADPTHTINALFLPALPARGATRRFCAEGSTLPFLPALPARGATEWTSAANP